MGAVAITPVNDLERQALAGATLAYRLSRFMQPRKRSMATNSENKFLVEKSLIGCALAIEVHLRPHPRLARWIIPKKAREDFETACYNYRKLGTQ
jgi:hypothetical protein